MTLGCSKRRRAVWLKGGKERREKDAAGLEIKPGTCHPEPLRS